MYCINRVPAIKPGNDRGAAITVGGKMKGKYGPMKGKVVFPIIEFARSDLRFGW
jgi:dissimilatory sulfite reductase (desulfoviridin) alpha/beta subunit